MIAEIYDYREAGFRFFGLHGADNSGCACGNPECKAIMKHPRVSRWQSVPDWSDEQLETWQELGWFKTGFGVLCSGWLIIDVDARNGGVESFRRLCAVAPEVDKAAFVVVTGSGGGSAHHYWRLQAPVAMVQHLDDYPGLDFKSSGYVVGAGSLHASGSRYESIRGYPQDCTDAPESLIELLRKPDRFRVSIDSGEIDIDQNKIVELLNHISPDCHYDRWIRVGMAIHHTLGGTGFELWDAWSAGDSRKYPGCEKLAAHWYSFGKSSSAVKFGTLYHYAREGGYCEPVEFAFDGGASEEQTADQKPVVDLLRPPGWVGELTKWINDQCLYPRENLAVAAALSAVSAIAGMRHSDEFNDISPNLFAFCVAASSTGKESIQQAHMEIIRTAGIQAAQHGGFKSEQELIRNLVRHQLALYSVDELGYVLKKLLNSGKSGASYLEGLIGLVMSVYSKANGYLPITGDMKEEIKSGILSEAGKVQKQIETMSKNGELHDHIARTEEKLESLFQTLSRVDDGISAPYLTIIGYTTPETFDELMTADQVKNGFLARAMVFRDLEETPDRKERFRKSPMSDGMKSAIQNLYAPGRFDMQSGGDTRIEHTGTKTPVATTPEAKEALDSAYREFQGMSVEHKERTGLHAIPRRGYEMTAKISILLAIPSGVRTVDHVVWAHELVKRDIENKIKMVYSNENTGKADGMAARILSLISSEHGETEGLIANKLRPEPKESVIALLAQMETKGMLRSEVVTKGRGAGKSRRYFAVDRL
jgi:hypothetical protein